MARPVLLIVFNRPDTTQQVVNAIANWDISTLYVAADGPRSDRDEEPLCAQTRAVATSLAQKFKVRTLFRDKNLGCGFAVAEAITWFFEHEEAGIILEDDCVPNSDFYRFCDELLDRHADDDQVMTISGNNFLWKRKMEPDSYLFIRHPHIWGWATWRRAWRHFDWEMAEWPDLRSTRWLRDVCHGSRPAKRYWRSRFDEVHQGAVDTWDYKWVYSSWRRGGLSITPPSNLVENLGFSPDATHTTTRPSWIDRLAIAPVKFPVRRHAVIKSDLDAERFTDLQIFGAVGLFKRVKRGIARRMATIQA